MSLRVIVWGPGGIGASAVRRVLTNADVELAGVRCYSPDKEGRDAGDLVGLDPCGIAATSDVAALLALDADCVLFAPRSRLSDHTVADSPERPWVDELLQILRNGKNVVSSIGSGVHWRHLENGAAWKAEVDAACADGGSTVLFTGRNPGFSTDALPATLANLSGDIEAIRTWEMVDLSGYSGVDALRYLGLGAKPDEARAVPGMIRATWGGSVHVMADACGVDLDELVLTRDGYVSERTFTASNGLTVEAGTVGALKFTLTGIVNGRPRLQVNHVQRLAPDMFPDQPSLGADGGFRIEVDGNPPIRGDFPFGLPGGSGTATQDAMAMTSARILNCVPAVVAAAPGYVTANGLPLLGPRFAVRS